MTHSLAIQATALLLGGMALYAFGFAAFRCKALPALTASATQCLAFAWSYLLAVATSALAAVVWWSHDTVAAAVMAIHRLAARQQK